MNATTYEGSCGEDHLVDDFGVSKVPVHHFDGASM
jgi:hypothetical protein